MILITIFLSTLSMIRSFRLHTHPLEKRIAYVYGIKDINNINDIDKEKLYEAFCEHPLLIFKDVDSVSPKEFLQFVQQFDKDSDKAALEDPDKYPQQMLQPFDQIPDCKHVAPRGNIELLDFYDIKKIDIVPGEAFVDNYVWHTDLLGHPTKTPNIITGFYIIEQPLIGGDTDFISGQTVYENLKSDEKLASHKIHIEINRKKFLTKEAKSDYAGVNRVELFVEDPENTIRLPLVFYDPNDDVPSVLIMPSFFERVMGSSVEDSRRWIRHFMCNRVLPHRVSIQWKKGDLAVFNNRKFMHSSTPARNYMENDDSNRRLLLQTFIPTKRAF